MKKTAKCIVCGNVHGVEEMKKVVNPKTHYSYMCSHCFYQVGGYSSNEANATNSTGTKEKTISITTGIELETSGDMDQRRLKVLESYNWKATEDCSISGYEYKSPVFNNLNGLAKLLYSVLDSPETGAGIPDRRCGTHVNVWSNELDSNDWQRIQNRYSLIFKDLYNEVVNDRNHDKLFGRKMNGWCDGFGTFHECMINMESCKKSHPRIEFRICKYHDNVQFMNCLKFCNECMKTILVNYSRNYKTDAEVGAAKATAHNDHKAEITAKKLVKVYKKYRGLI